MDFEKALTLLQVIHASVGIPAAAPVAAAAMKALIGLIPVAAVATPVVEEPELDLSGKPVEDEDNG